jgi:uncharacterized lipoprotein YajG
VPASKRLRRLNQPLTKRKPMKTCLTLLAIVMLAACSNLPMTSSNASGQVQHPDIFRSYQD